MTVKQVGPNKAELLLIRTMQHFGWILERHEEEGNYPACVTATSTNRAITHSKEMALQLKVEPPVILTCKDIISLFEFWCEENKIEPVSFKITDG